MEFRKHPWIFHDVVHVEPSEEGVLSGLKCAIKDNIDIVGHKTSAGNHSLLFADLLYYCFLLGNPDWLTGHDEPKSSAPVVSKLLSSGATVVGKVQTDELAISLSGKSYHYGIPLNPKGISIKLLLFRLSLTCVSS